MTDNADESVGTLDGTPEIERVYTQEETRLYRQKVILAYLGDEFVFPTPEPIRVENDEGKLIGFASMSQVGDKLVAEIAIDYATPERLSAETREGVRHYAHLSGMKITLSSEKPSNKSLQPFGELVL